MKVLRYILALLSLLGILGQLGQIGSPANQAGVFGVMFFWAFILAIVMYYERKSNGKKIPDIKHQFKSTTKMLVVILIAVVVFALAMLMIQEEPTYSTSAPVVATESVQVPEVEQKPAQDPLDPQTILQLVNEERAKVGQYPLVIDDRLSKSAEAKCIDMQLNDYFTHEDKQGNSPFVLIRKYYIGDKLGENLIFGAGESSIDYVNRWMSSPKHKENILDSSFTLTGIYVCTDDPNWTRYTDGHYAVQHFAN